MMASSRLKLSDLGPFTRICVVCHERPAVLPGVSCEECRREIDRFFEESDRAAS